MLVVQGEGQGMRETEFWALGKSYTHDRYGSKSL